MKDFSGRLLDFHTHSTCSDGSDSPKELVRKAKQEGIVALALTDHNVISGLEEFNYWCKKQGIISIPFGMEFFAELPEGIVSIDENAAPDLVLLAKSPRVGCLEDYFKFLLDDREKRFIPEILNGLSSAGFYVPSVNLKEQAKILGIPPIFRSIVYEKNNLQKLVDYVHQKDLNIKEEEIINNPARFMNQYLYAVGKPAHSKRIVGFDLKDAISLAKEANCKIFIAHPGGPFGNLSERVLEYMISEGVNGIEVRNYFNSPEQNQYFDKLAKEHNLIKSGGSDYHGLFGQSKLGMKDRVKNQLNSEILNNLLDGLPS